MRVGKVRRPFQTTFGLFRARMTQRPTASIAPSWLELLLKPQLGIWNGLGVPGLSRKCSTRSSPTRGCPLGQRLRPHVHGTPAIFN